VEFVRRCASLIVPVTASDTALTDWEEGPFPFSHGPIIADAEGRSSYFDPRIGRALYGADRPTRYYQRPPLSERAGFVIRGLELSLLPEHFGSADALLTVHGDLPATRPLEALRKLSHFPGDAEQGTRRWYESFTSGVHVAPTVKRASTMVLFTPGGGLERAMPSEYSSWTVDEQWLWLLASATPVEMYPPPVGARDQVTSHLLRFSRDWTALVLRDGAAFLGARPDEGERDPFFGAAEVYFRSIYVDALLLGMIQRMGLHAIADDIASVDDPQFQPDQVQRIERRLSRFRNVYWWTHLSGHGHANDLTTAYGRQHRLPELATQLFNELSEFSRQIQTAAADRTNALLGLITLLGLPIGATIGVLQVLGNDSALVLAITVAVATAMTFALIRYLARPVFDPMVRAIRNSKTTPDQAVVDE
jgi:hypothetical protein